MKTAFASAAAPGALPSGQVLRSYTQLREAAPSEHHAPRDLERLADILRRAEQQRRRVTVRAGGRSFDDQAMNGDVVVDVSAFDRVLALDAAKKELTVEAGARWGDICSRVLEVGLAPHIVPTTPSATVGGALAANCISRSSPLYGHLGDHVRALELLTVEGRVLRCSRDENAELFGAVIGGFGYFGVVTSVTLDLLALGPRRSVQTVIERCEGLAPFVERLRERSHAPGSFDAVYAVFSLASPQRGAVLRSGYTTEAPSKPFILHEPWAWYRPALEALFSSERLANALCHASYQHLFWRGPFVDSYLNYAFCMEGHERTRQLASRVGVRMRALQPSYIIPEQSLLRFLQRASQLFTRFDVYPALLDTLFVPEDGFLLSSSNRLPGFCTSFMFEGVVGAKRQKALDCMTALNDACLEAGGRLHLVKNLHGTRAQLKAMYGHALDALARLKGEVDPRGLLSNDFFSRAFG